MNPMKLEANNNGGIIYRIAKSNLEGKRLYTFFSMVTIALSLTFIMAVTLFLQETETSKERILGRMQHVMFLDMPEQEFAELSQDARVELALPYKGFGDEYEQDGVKYSFTYQKSRTEGIQTYVLAEGKEPEQYHEIAVDREFMERLGRECRIGEELSLNTGEVMEDFVICGLTDRRQERAVYPIYVSRAYAAKSRSMGNRPYTALIRIAGASEMEFSVFETAVYDLAADYGVKRADVNINSRFEESLREDNPIFQAMLLVSAFILAAAGIVIYTIFYLSVTSRTRQIGQFLTIGMTERQIRKMVRREGFWLCAVSVPAALLLGGGIAYVLEPEGWSFVNYLLTAAAAGIFGFVMVQISVSRPAVLASRVSPIEASKVSCEEGCEDRGERSGRKNKKAKKKREQEEKIGHRRLTPFVLAQIGQGRGRKKRRLMTLSVSFGGIVFMIAVTYLYAWDEEAFSRTGIFANAEYVVSYRYNAHDPLPYGPTQMQLTGHLGGELEERIRELAHVKSVKTERAVFGNVEYQGASWQQGFYRLTEESEDFYEMEAEGNTDYEYLCETDGVLITGADFLSQLIGVTFQAGDSITLRWFDGEEHETKLPIAGIVSEMNSLEGGYEFAMTDRTMEKLWGNMNTAVSFYISAEDYAEYGGQTEEELLSVLEPYQDLSLATLREQMMDDSANIRKIKLQIYGISAFVILFSVLNLINMMIGNIAARKRELSMLEAVGMEVKQIRNMLFCENILFLLPAMAVTLAVGSFAGYGTVSVFQKIIHTDYMEYRFPVVPSLLFAAGLLLIPLLISELSLKGIDPGSYNQDV